MDNEYLYKLGVDAGDLDAAVSATISIVGELDSVLGTKMPRSTATFVGALEKVRVEMNGVAVDSAKVSTSLGEQSAAFAAYIKRLDDARIAYKAFREDQLTGEASGRAVFDPTTASDAKLQEIVATQKAAVANVVQAAQTELNARKTAYEEEAAYHQSMQDAITASAAAAEQRRVQDALAQAKAIETASADAAQKRIADEKMVTLELAAEQEAQLQKFQAMQAAFVQEQQAFNRGNAARYGLATGDNLTVGTTQTRNTAARNSGFTARSQSIGAQSGYADIASQQTLAAMRDYYTAEEQSSKAAGTLAAATVRTAVATNQTATAQAGLNTHMAAGLTALPRMRYALYDVSTTLSILGVGLASVSAGIAKVATDYQADFASVARTSNKDMTGGQLANLKSDLVDLSTQIPVTFKDITSIATLGNQLGIDSTQITNFTKVVAEFAASSNLSVDAAATAFGRLGQIFHTTNYQAIGDQIAYLGVKAVATESQIVGVAGQIAVTGRAYGLTQQQTLALATAYASLGVKAESARGTTVRMFSDLQKAAVQGGAALSQIGDVTGLGAKGFQQLWNSDSNAAMTKFLEGLSKYGSNTKAVLAELGITAQRDITNVGLLSQNVNVLLDAQKNVTKAGGSLQLMFDRQNNTVAGQLTIAQNKFQAFLNSLGQSGQGPLKGLIDNLNSFLGMLDKVGKDPLAAWGLAALAGIVGLTGALMIGSGVAAQYVASLLALQTMTETLGADGTKLGGIWSALTGQAMRQKQAADAQTASLARVTAAVEALGTAQNGQAASAERSAAAQGRWVTMMGHDGVQRSEFVPASEGAVTPANAESGAVRSGLSVRDEVVVSTLSKEQAVLNAELAQTSLNYAKLSGDTAAIEVQEAALAAATDELALVLAQENAQMTAAARAALVQTGNIERLTWATKAAADAQVILSKAQADAAVSANALTVAEEKNSAENLANSTTKAEGATTKLSRALGAGGLIGSFAAVALMLPTIIDGIRQMGDTLDGTAVEADKLTSKILGLSNKNSGAQNLADLKKSLQAGNNDNPLSNIGNFFYAPLGNSFQGNNGHQYNAAQGAVNQLTTGQSTPGTSISYGNGSMLFDKSVQSAIDGYGKFDQALSASIQKGDLADAKTALAAFDKEMQNSGISSDRAEKILTNTAAALGATKGQSLAAALASKQSSAAAAGQAKAFSTVVQAAFATGNAATTMEKDMGALGKSFVVNGTAATIGGGALQKVIEQIYADTGGGPAAAAEMQGLFDTLVKGGFASAAQLKPLADIINQLTHGQKIAGTAVDGADAMYAAYNKAAEAANKAANAASNATEKAARTLMDYGNDIGTVIGNMLSYQFGVGDAQDKITSGWDQIKNDAAAARDSVKSIKADLLQLQATKATAQFDLGIANLYGDSLGKANAQGALAKANTDIAAKNKDLAKAQDASSMSLTGNSDAAIKNRAALEGQISSVQGYVAALAESGASQKQIDAAIEKSKQEFVAHATQLGYNKTQVNKLAAAFDGMKTIVNAIPRNITTGVNAHTSAAMKALADYRSSIKQTNQMAVNTPITTTPKHPGTAIGNSIMDGLRATLGSQGAFDFIFQTPAGKKQKEGSLILQANQGTKVTTSNTSTGKDPFGFPAWLEGGYTGNGGRYDIAGFVHGQEFVLNATGTRMIPRPILEAANQGRAPQSSSPTIVIGGGGKSGGFSAQDRMFLAQVLSAKPSITLSANQFGRAIDGANAQMAQRGGG